MSVNLKLTVMKF